jgi:uncharacterized protein (DUF305 family)
MSKRVIALLGAVAIAAVVAVAVVLIASSGDDEAQANETDGAFIEEMTAHHESAIEMAEVAQRRAEHSEIESLADEIIAAQSSEIDQLEVDHERIFGEPLAEMAAEHGDLGLPAHEAGMEADMAELEEARQFDRAFIDMMVPHHQGAIRMARIELEEGEDDELAALANAIIEAQSHEIEEMNSWREDWYGAPSPARGVPPEDEEIIPSHEEMGHE